MEILTEGSEVTHSNESEKPNLMVASERIKKAEDLLCEKLNLSKLKLIEIPTEVMDLTHLRKLYLSQNMLLQIPDIFFVHLSRLTWLDLRANLLSSLPKSIKCLSALQVLLIDDNRIRVLPFELGLLKKLKSLHIRNNPIEFPPRTIIESGAKNMMRYLLDCYMSREQAATPKGRISYMRVVAEQNRPSSNLNNAGEPGKDSVNMKDIPSTNPTTDIKDCDGGRLDNGEECNQAKQDNTIDQEPVDGVDGLEANGHGDVKDVTNFMHELDLDAHEQDGSSSEEEQNNPRRGSLQPKSQLYRKVETAYFRNRRRSSQSKGKSAFAIYPSQTTRHEVLLPDEPSMPSLNYIRSRYMNERKRIARQKIMATRSAAIQKLKDAEKIRSWREQYVNQKRQKMLEYLRKNEQDIKDESMIRTLNAPFDLVKNDLKVIGSNELYMMRQKTIGPDPKPDSLDPHTILQLELASIERDKRLAEQVKEHMGNVVERFNAPIPDSKGAIHDELLGAKRDLDRAIRLHQRVQQRLETLHHFHGSNRRDLW